MSIQVQICRTRHVEPERRWVAHLGELSDFERGTRIAKRRDGGEHVRKYAETWEEALALAAEHLEQEEDTTCGWCHHPGIVPCEAPSPNGGSFRCTRAKGHGTQHVACGDDHALRVWAGERLTYEEALGRRSRPAVEYCFAVDQDGNVHGTSTNRVGIDIDTSSRNYLGRLVEQVRDGDDPVQVYGVKIAPCDTYGRTARERTLEEQRDTALEETSAGWEAEHRQRRATVAQRKRADELEQQLEAAQAEVCVDGDWFPPADLPEVLSSTRQRLAESREEAKREHVRANEAEARLDRDYTETEVLAVAHTIAPDAFRTRPRHYGKVAQQAAVAAALTAARTALTAAREARRAEDAR